MTEELKVNNMNDQVFDLMSEKTKTLDLDKVDPNKSSDIIDKDSLNYTEKRIQWFGDEYLDEYHSLESGRDRSHFKRNFFGPDDKNTYRKYRHLFDSFYEFNESEFAGDTYSRNNPDDPSIHEWADTFNFMEKIPGEGDDYSQRWFTEDKEGNLIRERTSMYSGTHPNVQITRGEEQIYKQYGSKGWENVNE